MVALKARSSRLVGDFTQQSRSFDARHVDLPKQVAHAMDGEVVHLVTGASGKPGR